jgi:hypothetical protein
MRRGHIAGLAGVLIAAAPAAAAQETTRSASEVESAAGVYTLTRVNNRAIPARSWARQQTEATCNTETRSGTLLLDSKGRWASFMTERDRCTLQNNKREVLPDVSTIFTGEYSVRGDSIELRDQVNSATYMGKISAGGNVITVAVTGTGALDGQRVTYVVRRARMVR